MADDIYTRVRAEVERQGKTMDWLAAQIGVQPPAVSMWRTRGVPRSQYPGIAIALGQSVEWVMGEAERAADRPLSPMALRIAREFDAIQDPTRQLDALARCLTAIGRVRGDGPELQ